MAAKTAAELAAQNPRLKAMLVELGIARLDDLPMEDGEGRRRGRDMRTYFHPSKLSSGAPAVVPKFPIKSAWAQAIQRGDFDDDDAAQVAGMDSMADGQLARARRNQVAVSTFSFAIDNYDKNTHTRRDRNGYVPPRATASNPGKRNVPGPANVGDGPIDINSNLVGDDARRPRPKLCGPMTMASNHGALAGGPSSRSAAHVQPLQPPRALPGSAKCQPDNFSKQEADSSVPTQAAALQPQDPRPQDVQPATQAETRIVLPDGASIVLQLSASLGAAAFPKRSQTYNGTIYLVSASQPSNDLIVFAVRDRNISEIRHFISEYDTYISVSNTGLMLKFTDHTLGFLFYGVDFENAADTNSFVEALRNLDERPTLAVSAVEDKSTTNDTVAPGVKIQPTQPASLISVEAVKPAATRISEVIIIAEQKTGASLQKHKKEDRTDMIARQSTELRAKMQPEAVSVPAENLTAPEPIAENFSAANLVFASMPDKPEPVATSEVHATSNITKPVEKQPAQAVTTAVQQTQVAMKFDPEVAEQILRQSVQAPSAPAQRAQAEFGVVHEVIEEIIDCACDAAVYMRNNAPEEFDFDTMRSIIQAVSAAVIGRSSSAFRQLNPADQQLVIDSSVRPHVENGFLKKCRRDEPFATEFMSTEMDQSKASEQLPEIQNNAEAQAAVAPLNPPEPVYEIEELMSLRSAAAAVDYNMLYRIPGLFKRPAIRPNNSELPRVPVKAQVKQAAETSLDWLYAPSFHYRYGVLADKPT